VVEVGAVVVVEVGAVVEVVADVEVVVGAVDVVVVLPPTPEHPAKTTAVSSIPRGVLARLDIAS
jgi:hypothetical protein